MLQKRNRFLVLNLIKKNTDSILSSIEMMLCYFTTTLSGQSQLHIPAQAAGQGYQYKGEEGTLTR